ncbi:Alpha-L-fucosidase [Neorhodopirellula pilleata]|uniref:alpha-L-fucosidase n=2 Tax=Neorhodopirellula pilleata TaxID=2714738 RepID=A0A5C6ATX4_9BACT|nr:Alpha-L-fucosidase [Neorhodopirellula pilleata]
MDATPFKRDIIKELADECKKQDMHFGVYYSQFKDWYHRSRGRNKPGTMTNDEYLEFVENQLDELLTNYGEMAVLWFDVGGNDVIEADRQGARVRELQPNTVICSRLYSRRVPTDKQKYADFESLPDRTIAPRRMEGDVETCMTMRLNWGYDRNDANWKSTKDVIERLVLSAARGVNFLLNVGPMPEGTLCPEEIERLAEIGQWMKLNGESIYGTDYSPVDFDFPWGAMTQKDRTVYLHVMKWNPEGVVFNGIVGKPAKAYLLADPDHKTLPVKYDPALFTKRAFRVETIA